MRVYPSIFAADLTDLSQEISSVKSADGIHIDIMDGRFVPNLTFGPDIVSAVRKLTKQIIDVHLMVNDPENYIDMFHKAGADTISFHIEATNHADRLIDYIKSKGMKAGVVLNPSTHESTIAYLLHKLDYTLVMTVNPGYSKQPFLINQIEKIGNIKKELSKKSDVEIMVDGGVSLDNRQILQNAGADIAVIGSALFNTNNYDNIICNFQQN